MKTAFRGVRRWACQWLALAATLASVPATAASLTLDSRVDRVTLYRNGAQVERVAELTLPAGDSEVRITDLPAGLDVARVALAVDGAAVRLSRVRRSTEQRLTAVNDDVEQLENELRRLGNEERVIADAIRTAELKLKFLEGLAAGYAKQSWFEVAQGGGDTGTWGTALGTLEAGASEALASIRAQQTASVALEQRRSQLERQLAELRGRDKAATVLALTASTETAQTVTLRLRYLQLQASWTPTLEARMDSGAGVLALLQQATVTQRTVETWDNVELTLSTGNPRQQVMPPSLGPEFLNLYDPRQVRFNREADTIEDVALTASKQKGAVALAAAPPPAEIAPNVTQFGVSYTVPGRVTVANGASDEQRFDLDRQSYDAELVTRVVPSRLAAGFLLARFSYDGDAPLAASRLRAYLDGDYVGESRLPAARRGETVELALGENRRLEVRVEDQGGQDGESGILSKRREEAVDMLYEITNRGSEPMAIEVVDRLPVAENEAVEVEVPRSATKPTATDVDDQPGMLRWVRSLAPGEAWSIRHQYRISYPADQRLSRRQR
ncbi:MAG: mucoidy inhibitor MuiA family protein [Pseudomonadota bacterium]